jgi:glucose-6-phosphate isomerase
MDVGRREHEEELRQRNLLFGIVVYPAGKLGQEPGRSQGHVHAVSSHSGWSAPELFEIWEGHAIIYAQQHAQQDPGVCIAIEAGPGDQVVVPPGWAHCVINADPNERMIFAACCDREYGFVYDEIRSRGGLAWFPSLGDQNQISWEPNPRYHRASLMEHKARSYRELDLVDSISIYQQFARCPDSLQWVSEPALYADLWPFFIP